MVVKLLHICGWYLAGVCSFSLAYQTSALYRCRISGPNVIFCLPPRRQGFYFHTSLSNTGLYLYHGRLFPITPSPAQRARFSVSSLDAMEFCLSLRCKRACCPCSSSLRPLRKGCGKAGEALGMSPSSSLSSPVCLWHKGISSGLLPCSQTFLYLVEL